MSRVMNSFSANWPGIPKKGSVSVTKIPLVFNWARKQHPDAELSGIWCNMWLKTPRVFFQMSTCYQLWVGCIVKEAGKNERPELTRRRKVIYSLDFLQVPVDRTFFPILGHGWLKRKWERQRKREKKKSHFIGLPAWIQSNSLTWS